MKRATISAKWGTRTDNPREKEFEIDLAETVEDLSQFDSTYVVQCFNTGHRIAEQRKVRETIKPQDPAAYARSQSRLIYEELAAGKISEKEAVERMIAVQKEVAAMSAGETSADEPVDVA